MPAGAIGLFLRTASYDSSDIWHFGEALNWTFCANQLLEEYRISAGLSREKWIFILSSARLRLALSANGFRGAVAIN